mgnify:CR=1 FL=1
MFKKIFKLLFPFKLPVSKRVFDSWYKTLDDACRMAYLSALPYFWLTKDALGNRIRDALLLLVLAYVLQTLAYELDKRTSQFVDENQEDGKDKS